MPAASPSPTLNPLPNSPQPNRSNPRRWLSLTLLLPCLLGQCLPSLTNTSGLTNAHVAADGHSPPTAIAARTAPRAQDPDPVDDSGWIFTTTQPADDWMQVEFSPQGWTEAKGGFGTPGTPAARIGTLWNTSDIWLRKSVNLEPLPDRLTLWIHHDEDADVYLNGQRLLQLSGYTTAYRAIELNAEQHQLVRPGQNLLAIHCRQTGGGQYLDAHLVDAARNPELLPVQRAETPFKSELTTPWGEQLDRNNPWPEYPRPAFVRQAWQNLNGPWQYAITSARVQETPTRWEGTITVPFALESALSGVQRLLKPEQCLWYQRTFQHSAQHPGRTLLHFEAVDYECRVWVNGQQVGTHRGGHTPFSFDITDALHAGDNDLVVRVIDRTEMMQLRGKQVLDPQGIWYTQVSGIWQTVWLEDVPTTYLVDCTTQPNALDNTVKVTPQLSGPAHANCQVQFELRAGPQVVATGAARHKEALVLHVPNAQHWSPQSPFLYDLHMLVVDAEGEIVDRVESYVGLRSVGKQRDANGHWQMTLNGQPLFHWGPLDQGWWPDGLLTPPSDEAMRFDVDYLKAAGFNMIRKHIKVEPRRFYSYCDRIGMLVWQDQVSGGTNPPWTRLAPDPVDAEWSDTDHQQFMTELDRMITSLHRHPSIVVWVPFNEAWGQHRTLAVGQWTRERDPSRLVNIASGGNFWPVGDIVDHHEYPHPDFPFVPARDAQFVMVVGEFGGHGLPVRGHLWNPEMDNWGYGGLPQSPAEYLERLEESWRRLHSLRQRGIAGAVYTQTTDVEGEINGLLTYDRRVLKIPADQLRALGQRWGFVP